jgi:hypothetical protein
LQASEGLDALQAKSSLVRELTTQLYALWRSEVGAGVGEGGVRWE